MDRKTTLKWWWFLWTSSKSFPYHVAVVVQLPSHVWLFVTPWTAACQASLSLTISQSLPKFMFIALVMPFSPSTLDFSQHQGLFQWVIWVNVRWSKYCSFSIGPSREYSRLIFLKIDWFDLLQSKGLSGVFSTTTVEKHQFFGVLPSLWSSSHNHMWPLGRP